MRSADSTDRTDPPRPGHAPRALLLNGSVGAGKTTVAYAVGELLARAGVAHAVIDVDAVAQFWPAPSDDPFNERLRHTNVTAVWTQLRAAGARFAVLAGVVETAAGRSGYAAALPDIDLQLVRLHAPVERLRERVRRRDRDHGAALEWHLRRTAELADVLESAAVDDFTVTNDRPLHEVAGEVLRRVGWFAPAECDRLAASST